MALTRFTLVRRFRFLDGVIEAALGAAVFLLPVVLAIAFGAAGTLIDRALTSFGALGGLLLGILVMSLSEGPIRRIAVQPGVNRGKLTVGNDGLRVTGLMLERFVPYAEISGIVYDEPSASIIVERRDARPLRFRVPEESLVLQELRARLELHHGRTPASPVPAFRDARSDFAAFVERAKNALGGGYRQGATSPDVLVRVAEDPSADPEQRIGAALALSKGPEPLRLRVAAAAEDVARPELAEAMTEALEDSLEAPRVKRAVATGR